MPEILVYAEVQKGEIKKGAFEITSKAKALGGQVSACIIGKDVEGLAGELGKYGADKVFSASGEEFNQFRPSPMWQASSIRPLSSSVLQHRGRI